MTKKHPSKRQATLMKPEKTLRKWFVYNFNRRINELRKAGKL